MSTNLLNLFDQSICVRLTQTLAHFLWQGLLIGCLTLIGSWICRTGAARVRYFVNATGLILMALCVPVTFGLIESPAVDQAEVTLMAVIPAPTPDLSENQNRTSTLFAESIVNVRPAVPTDVGIIPVPPVESVKTFEPMPIVDLAVPQMMNPNAGLDFVLRTSAPYAAAIYCLGVMFMFGRLCCALWGGHRLRRCAVPINNRQLLSKIRSQANRIGLKFVPVVAYCERITIPVVVGILRPMILLPVWIATEIPPEQLLLILTHEMAHIRRLDLIVNLLQRLLETVLFFHPAVWYISRRLSFERENCCDDAVIQAGFARVQYASTLVRLAELCAANRRPTPQSVLALAATGRNGSELKRRVIRLLNDPQRLRLTRGDSFTLLLIFGLIGGMMAGLWRHTEAAPVNEPEPPVADAKPAAPAEKRELEFDGTVVDFNGKPLAGAEIWFALRSHSPTDVKLENEPIRLMGHSDSQGKFSFRLEPIEEVWPYTILDWRHLARVIAKAPGHGCDWLPLAAFEQNPVPSRKREELVRRIDEGLGTGRFAERTLKLPKEAGDVRGRLVDLEGNPLVGITVSVDDIQNPDPVTLAEAFQKNSPDLVSSATWKRWMPVGPLTRNDWDVIISASKTDKNGEFVLMGLGRDQMATLTLLGERVAAEQLFVVGNEMEKKTVPHMSFYPNGALDVYTGINFSHVVGPSVPVVGTVTEFKSGKPITNAVVSVERLYGSEGMNSVVQLRFARHIRTRTDSQGRYQLIGIPPGKKHVLNVNPPKSEPWLMAAQEISIEPDQDTAKVDIQVFRGIWLEGNVTDSETGDPIKGRVDYLALQTNPNIPERFGLRDSWEMDRYPTDSLGNYRVAGLPGPGLLLVRSYGTTVYPLSVGADKIEGYDASINYLPTSPIGLPLSNWHRVQYIDPAVDAQSHRLDLTLSAGPSVKGKIVGPNNAELANLHALGLNTKAAFFERLNDNSFTVHNYEPSVGRNLFFKAADNTLVGSCQLQGTPPENLIVELQPAVTVRGRLIETELDDFAVGYGIDCESSKQGHFRIDDTTTDEKGMFVIKGLLAGNIYEMHSANVQHFVSGKNDFKIDLSKAKPGDVIDLGDVTGKNAKTVK